MTGRQQQLLLTAADRTCYTYVTQHTQTHARTVCQRPLSSVIYHSVNVLRLQFIIQPPSTFATLLYGTSLTGSSTVIFLYLFAFVAQAIVKGKQKLRNEKVKKMNGKSVPDLRFVIFLASTLKPLHRDGCVGWELGKIAINVDLKFLPAIIGNN